MIEIRKVGEANYRFQIKNEIGNTILDSISFSSQDEVDKTVSELIPLIDTPGVFERKTDYSGKFLFNLKNLNGQIIGSSQMYDSEAGMENGINNVKNSIAMQSGNHA